MKGSDLEFYEIKNEEGSVTYFVGPAISEALDKIFKDPKQKYMIEKITKKKQEK